MVKKVIIASTNPVKIDAARDGFTAMFPDQEFTFDGVHAQSGINEQPWGEAETLQGAWNRIAHAKTLRPNGDYYVANESGIQENGSGLSTVNWVVITDGTRRSQEKSTSYPIPTDVARVLRGGAELGPAFEKVFGAVAAKQGAGGVGALTHGNMPRNQLIAQAVMTALIPFKNPELYGG